MEEVSLSEVVLYPNPVSQSGEMVFSNVSTSLDEVVFYDISGKQVYAVRSPQVKNEQVALPVDLTAGVYLVKVIAEDAQITKKLIVE